MIFITANIAHFIKYAATSEKAKDSVYEPDLQSNTIKYLS